ncbi:DJ-1/PfpI family protein [Acidobacteria bacterium AB60]|nr:DJ-1/PfpI family protein [Acidobacteria bacterium AB60]
MFMSLARGFILSVCTTILAQCAVNAQQPPPPASRSPHYRVPEKGKIPVAFVISDDAVTIDFAGPWQVFKDVFIQSRGKTLAEQSVFSLYTVSDSRQPVGTFGGMQIIPDYTFDNAPEPTIVVIPAQKGRSTKMLTWIQKMSLQSDVVMSVCTGANVLGDAGLLRGKPATTHHLFYSELHNAFPDVLLQKNRRFVQSDPIIFAAGGLSSGMDLALHIVKLYVGASRAEETAKLLEYEGTGWEGDGTEVAGDRRSKPN